MAILYEEEPMAFHLYEAVVVEQKGTAVRLRLTGAGIPHTVTGQLTCKGEILEIHPRAAQTEDGTQLQVKPGEAVFYDPKTGKASYDFQTLAT